MRLPNVLKQRFVWIAVPAVLLILGLGARVLQWTGTTPAAEPARPRIPQGVAGLGVQRAQQMQEELAQQKRMAEVVEQVPKLEKTIEHLTAALQASKQEKERTAQEFGQQLASLKEDMGHRFESQERALREAQQRAAQQQRQPATTTKGASPPASPTSPAPSPGSKIYLLESSASPPKHARQGRSNNRDVPFLPPGSFADAEVIFGLMANSKEKSAGPMIFGVKGEFHGPYQLQGPSRAPLQTALEIQGCLVEALGGGNLAQQRMFVELKTLSCVFPGGDSFVVPIQGYAVDLDNTYGIVAEVAQHESAVAARVFLTGLIQEAGAVFSAAGRQVTVASSAFAGGSQPFQPMQSTLSKFADFYLQQMQYLLPTLWAKAGKRVRLVLLEGVALEGYPTQILLTKGQATSWAPY